MKKVEEKKEEVKDPTAITERDFKNPRILMFTTELQEGDNYPSWRDLEKDLQVAYPTIKMLYSRMKDNVGQMAISSHSTDQKAVDTLTATPFNYTGIDFKFAEATEDELKEFWEKHGSHYEMVIKQRLRKLKKRKRDEGHDASAKSKAMKTSESDKAYKIAGTPYANINKVKSKAKAIMNIKEDGQKLEGYEDEFMREIIKHHDKHEEKMANFSHFTVDEHPSFKNTR